MCCAFLTEGVFRCSVVQCCLRAISQTRFSCRAALETNGKRKVFHVNREIDQPPPRIFLAMGKMVRALRCHLATRSRRKRAAASAEGIGRRAEEELRDEG